MVRLKDIADRVGVSQSTVSRILNNDDTLSVAPETRTKVLQITKELGYHKRPRKRSTPSLKQLRTVGIIQWYSMSEELEDPYYFSIRLSVERECFENDIQYIKYFKENIERVGEVKLDGLICVGKFSLKQIEEFSKTTKNIVFVDSNPNEQQFHSVTTDFRMATQMVMEYLHRKGHRNVGYIGGKEFLGPENVPYIDRRERTYYEFMANNSEMIFSKKNVHIGTFTARDGYRLMIDAIKQGNLPTAFVIASDSMAIGALRAIYETDPTLAQKVSLISFNDISTAQFTNPALTTIKVDTNYMGELAVKLINQFSRRQMTQPFRIVIPSRLIKRDSVKTVSNQKTIAVK